MHIFNFLLILNTVSGLIICIIKAFCIQLLFVLSPLVSVGNNANPPPLGIKFSKFVFKGFSLPNFIQEKESLFQRQTGQNEWCFKGSPRKEVGWQELARGFGLSHPHGTYPDFSAVFLEMSGAAECCSQGIDWSGFREHNSSLDPSTLSPNLFLGTIQNADADCYTLYVLRPTYLEDCLPP